MTVVDYNGSGRWSRVAIIERYRDHALRFRVVARDLSPAEHFGEGKHWIYPVMQKVIEAVEAGDVAAAEVALEFIEESDSFPFGRTLKSNAARALRRYPGLMDEQKARIRRRVVGMLVSEYLPREFREYAKLGKKLGVQNELEERRAEMNLTNPWVKRYVAYLGGSPGI